MKQYMIEVWFPDDFTPEMMALVPRQRMIVNHLLRKGRLRSYTLSGDRRRLWLVVLAREASEIDTIINAFPLAPYMTYEVQELAFHNTVNEQISSISLN